MRVCTQYIEKISCIPLIWRSCVSDLYNPFHGKQKPLNVPFLADPLDSEIIRHTISTMEGPHSIPSYSILSHTPNRRFAIMILYNAIVVEVEGSSYSLSVNLMNQFIPFCLTYIWNTRFKVYLNVVNSNYQVPQNGMCIYVISPAPKR